jgi:hypothetical protein
MLLVLWHQPNHYLKVHLGVVLLLGLVLYLHFHFHFLGLNLVHHLYQWLLKFQLDARLKSSLSTGENLLRTQIVYNLPTHLALVLGIQVELRCNAHHLPMTWPEIFRLSAIVVGCYNFFPYCREQRTSINECFLILCFMLLYAMPHYTSTQRSKDQIDQTVVKNENSQDFIISHIERCGVGPSSTNEILTQLQNDNQPLKHQPPTTTPNLTNPSRPPIIKDYIRMTCCGQIPNNNSMHLL